MKNFKTVYEGEFSKIEDIAESFNVLINEISMFEIIYACYDREDYEGAAVVIYKYNNKIYEVNGSHCSCNGLEGCWSPEETLLEALLMRKNVSIAAKQALMERFQVKAFL